MTTDGVVSTGRAARRWGTSARIFALGSVAVVGLAGCGAPDGVIDGWWDNGDPIFVPAKASLFDEQLNPLCDTPTFHGTVETRSRSFSEAGGVVNAFLFEVTNPETDPATAQTPRERNRLEILANSTEAMYELTWPGFDAERSISGPDDLRSIKDELKAHLPGLGVEEPLVNFVSLENQWIEGPTGYYSVRRAADPQGFIDENNIDTTFNGVQNTYWTAIRDDGEQFLLVRNKESGEAVLMTEGAEPVVLDEATESFSRYLIELEPGTGRNPDASITLVNDQCRPDGKSNVARFWVYDYELLDGEEQGPVELT